MGRLGLGVIDGEELAVTGASDLTVAEEMTPAEILEKEKKEEERAVCLLLVWEKAKEGEDARDRERWSPASDFWMHAHRGGGGEDDAGDRVAARGASDARA